MPSDDLLLHFQDDFAIREHWTLNGTHYQKTTEAWLETMDANRRAIMDIFERTYGAITLSPGLCAGGCSLWLARSYGDTVEAKNGSSRITCLRSAPQLDRGW